MEITPENGSQVSWNGYSNKASCKTLHCCVICVQRLSQYQITDKFTGDVVLNGREVTVVQVWSDSFYISAHISTINFVLPSSLLVLGMQQLIQATYHMPARDHGTVTWLKESSHDAVSTVSWWYRNTTSASQIHKLIIVMCVTVHNSVRYLQPSQRVWCDRGRGVRASHAALLCTLQRAAESAPQDRHIA
jgi:hypothetical protein